MKTVEVPRVVTEIEAAEILGIRPRTLQDWRFRGVGPKYLSYGGGRRGAVRYRVTDLMAFMERAERTSTSDPGREAA